MYKLFDTHCHLNFKVFNNQEKEIISEAMASGVNFFIVPGTDLKTSQKAIKIAQKYPGVWAAVGIHPHHTWKLKEKGIIRVLRSIEALIKKPKVKAIGEIGLDKHQYQETKYQQYQISQNFIKAQKILFEKQINLAIHYNKALIIHNREASKEMLAILNNFWNKKLSGKTVFHCCEPKISLLNFALKHKIFIGINGDLTYNTKKKAFIKKVPLKNLVLETDSPYLTPKPIRNKQYFPNYPKSIVYIAKEIASIKKISLAKVARITTKNACQLFNIKI